MSYFQHNHRRTSRSSTSIEARCILEVDRSLLSWTWPAQLARLALVRLMFVRLELALPVLVWPVLVRLQLVLKVVRVSLELALLKLALLMLGRRELARRELVWLEIQHHRCANLAALLPRPELAGSLT